MTIELLVGEKEQYPALQPKSVYVVCVADYNRASKVIAVFKTAHALEKFFVGARASQLRYMGYDRSIEEIRAWYAVNELRVEG